MDTKIPAIVASTSDTKGLVSRLVRHRIRPLAKEHLRERAPFRRTCRPVADPSTGGTDNPRRGEGPRRGRRQGGASRAPRLSSSSARSATTRRRARSRRRRSSARQRTGRPLRKEHAAKCSAARNAKAGLRTEVDCNTTTDNPTSSKEGRRLLTLPLTPLRSSSSHSSRRGSLRHAAKSLPLTYCNRSAHDSYEWGPNSAT